MFDGRESAGAVFGFDPRGGRGTGAWRCVRAAPCISWMIDESPEAVAAALKGYLAREKGWTYEWARVYRV